MTIPPWPTNTTEITDAIRDEIGRDITISYLVSVSGCSYCNLDPVTGTSTDPFCEECDGAYWIPTYSGLVVNAHVNWGYYDKLGWVTGGQLDNGKATVQFKLTDANENAVKNAQYITVDNKLMYIDRIIKRGVPEPNRFILELKEEDDNE